MNSVRIVFMGSDAFATPALEALRASSHQLLACVTQPDRPSGRGRKVAACPVKSYAQATRIPVMTPECVDNAHGELAALAPDLIVVAAYGQYIPRRIIELPPLGCINIHPSLLPRYRGAAPIQWAIAHGETETGVTILDVSARMDAGPILLQERHPISPDDTTPTLEARLANAGAALLLRAIQLLADGKAVRTPQDEAAASWAPKLTKQDGAVDWSLPARTLHNRVRGFQPWPGVYCTAAGRRLAILETEVEQVAGPPGTLLECGTSGPLIACGEGALRLVRVQPEGKRPMSGADYARGARRCIGTTLA